MRNRVWVREIDLPVVVRGVGRQRGGHDVVGGVLVGLPATTDEPVGGTAVVGEYTGPASVDYHGVLAPPTAHARADRLHVPGVRSDGVVADRGFPAGTGNERGARLELVAVHGAGHRLEPAG